MLDPTSDLGEDVTEETAPECVTCGEKLVRDPAHRVITWIDDDLIQHRHVCSDECEAAWDGPN